MGGLGWLFSGNLRNQEHFANLLIAFYPKFRNLHSWCPAFTRLELDCFSDSRHRLSSETSGRMAQAPHYNSLPSVAVHFLGTCSGGGPIRSRNCSSLSVDLGNDLAIRYSRRNSRTTPSITAEDGEFQQDLHHPHACGSRLGSCIGHDYHFERRWDDRGCPGESKGGRDKQKGAPESLLEATWKQSDVVLRQM